MLNKILGAVLLSEVAYLFAKQVGMPIWNNPFHAQGNALLAQGAVFFAVMLLTIKE